MVQACVAAGVPECTPHGLRRMVATAMVRSSNPKVVSELTGHSVKVLLEIYVTPTDQDRRRAVVAAGLSLADGGQIISLGGV